MKLTFQMIAVLIGVTGTLALAQQEDAGLRAGPTLAVTHANLKDGFRLSEKAMQVVGVVTKPVGPGPHRISKSAVIYFGPNVGVYRLRAGWFKLVELQESKASTFSVKNPGDLKEDDQIVVTGGALLRVSEMDAFGGEQ